MVVVRPFRASDLDKFIPIELMSKDEIKDPPLAEAIEKSGLAVTGISHGKIVGCGGVHPMKGGKGEIWLRLSDYSINHPRETIRWLKDGMDIIEQSFPFKQLYAVIRCGFEKSHRLIEWLGFKQIQTKDDYIIYSKLVSE